MGLKQNFTAFWDRVTGKSLYEISQSVNTLEERINMMQLDLDAANIKLASTEIDLEASNVEKEVLKMELEEKKAEIARLKMTVATMQEEKAKGATAAITGAELEALAKKVAEEEYLASEYKARLEQVVNLLTVMSKEEKYSDIIRIQTNSIDENGKETRQVYMSFNDTTVQVDETVNVPTLAAAETTTAHADYTATASIGSGSQWLNGAAPVEAHTISAQGVSAVTPAEATYDIYESFVDIATAADILDGNTFDTSKVDEIVESVSEIADEIMEMAQ
ncbi:MAG: hypothetical protein MJ245_04950 [Clostridia bacterium]|nr:hypothetical protein [Clostridia bacterium]